MTKPDLTPRQSQVVALVARGLPDKRIAAELHISVRTVRCHIQAAADRIPGDSTPRHRFVLFFFGVEDDAA